jgi:hypothetical protein
MEAQRPITVFFGRGAFAPSQATVDLGKAAMLSGTSGLGGFLSGFALLQQFPVLNDGAGALLHLKGIVASLAGLMHSPWRMEWLEHLRDIEPAIRLAVAGRLMLAVGLGVGLGLLIWRAAVRPIDGYIHIRGRRLLEGKAALDAAKRVARQEIDGQADREDIRIHPEIRLSTDRMTKHGIVFGKVGGGKTTILLPMIAEIIAGRHKALIFDIKGDFTSKLWRKSGPVAILAPWDRRSLIWDIARDCRTRQDAARFASYLIKESKDPMWSAAARQLLVGFLVQLQMTRGEAWGWRDIADLLATPEKELLAMMSEANPEAIRAVEQTGTTTTGILINLSAFLSVVYDLAEAWPERVAGRMFSVREWIFNEKAKHRAVLLGGNQEFGPLMKAFAGALVAQAAAYVCSPRLADSRSRRLYFILDEFPQLGKVDIEPLVAVGRSKGARVWLGLQDFGQVKKLYGQDTAQAITAMVGTVICAGAAPGETAKFIADMVGSREVERNSLSTSVQGGASSVSTSQTWQRETIPVLTESQASGLGPVPGTKEIRALLLNFGNDALILRWPFDMRPTIAHPVDLADWTLSTVEKREQAQEQAEIEAILTLEGEEREEAQRKLEYARDLARQREAAVIPQPFDADKSAEWLAGLLHGGEGEARQAVFQKKPEPQEPAVYTVDAPSWPAQLPTPLRPENAMAETALAGQRPADLSAQPEAMADVGLAMAKLAAVAEAIRSAPGPTPEQAPAPRRTR